MATNGGRSTLFLLTLGEVSDAFRVSETTVRRMIERGELRAFRIGGQLRIDRDSVVHLLQRGEVRRGNY